MIKNTSADRSSLVPAIGSHWQLLPATGQACSSICVICCDCPVAAPLPTHPQAQSLPSKHQPLAARACAISKYLHSRHVPPLGSSLAAVGSWSLPLARMVFPQPGPKPYSLLPFSSKSLHQCSHSITSAFHPISAIRVCVSHPRVVSHSGIP